ncbi:MAG: L-threonylcarbamoyladenylate synthase [Flavobacteriales bacterium]
MAKISNNIEEAAQRLKSEVIAIPTETVYGLAANALNPELVARIFEIKQRPSFDPLIVHIGKLDQLSELILEFPEPLQRLANQFWPGPLTLLLPKSSLIPDIVTSGLSQVGIRMPSHPLTLALLNQIDFPLAAPSANPFGYISPTKAEHVEAQLGTAIDFILDGGPCEVGIESTIVGMEDDKVFVYRLGGLSPEQIRSQVGDVHLRINQSSNPAAPGMLLQHYAPRKRLFFTDNPKEIAELHQGLQLTLITMKAKEAHMFSEIFELSPTGNIKEAASRLFDVMRKADDSGTDIIIAEAFEESGLGAAINDRLRRAAINH